jgi:hypothetical protein
MQKFPALSWSLPVTDTDSEPTPVLWQNISGLVESELGVVPIEGVNFLDAGVAND